MKVFALILIFAALLALINPVVAIGADDDDDNDEVTSKAPAPPEVSNI